MDILNYITQVLSFLEPIVPGIIIAVIITSAVMVFLLSLSGRLWINQKRFNVLGVFYGLGGYNTIRLSCVWIKLILVIVYIVSFRELTTLHFFVFILISLISAIDIRAPRKILKNIIWILIELAGLLAVNMVCAYMRSFSYISVQLWTVYISFGILMILLEIYLFLNSVETISTERKINIDKEKAIIDRKHDEEFMEIQ